MGRKHTPGLYKRRGCWHIDKQLFGRRVCENTQTSSLEEAEKYLARKMEQMREAHVFGVRPSRTFREAATKYLKEKMHKARIEDDAMHLEQLDKYIGQMPLHMLHHGSVETFIRARQRQGCKTKTINLALGVLRHLLNLAATEWMNETGLTWLMQAPKIKMLPIHDARKPYPLSWEEQTRLFAELPIHLKRMALFKVNTGCREQEVCQLRWNWEVKLPEFNTSVFIIPGWIEIEVATGKKEWKQLVKNGEDRLVVLNDTAPAVIDEVRSIHPEGERMYEGVE